MYRQLDKNNRSLEKVRKFAESVRRDLNDFVEERTATIKDLETVLKVHDMTAAEILKRIQTVEANLLTRTPEIEQMQARLDRYAQAMAQLDAQTATVDENLRRLKEEAVFIDRISQRIKGAGEEMRSIEDAFGQIRQDFSDTNQKDLAVIRQDALQVFERETLAYVQQLRDAQKQVEGFQSFAGEVEKQIQDKADRLLEETDGTFRKTANEANDLASEIFVRLEQRIESQADATETKLRNQIQAQEDSLGVGVAALADQLSSTEAKMAEGTETLNRLLDEVRNETETVRARTESDLEGLQETLQNAAKDLQAEFQSEETQLLALTAQLKLDLEARVAEAKTSTRDQLESLRSEVLAALQEQRTAAEGLVEEAAGIHNEAASNLHAAEQKLFEDLEGRLKDYEATFGYRYSKMEEAEKDLVTLDQNLRQSMESVASKIQQDFAQFDEAMAQRRDDEKTQLDAEVAISRDALDRLDKDLEELKARAYDNVSAKLQGFEEEFFEDLQKRTALMRQSMDEWQSGVQEKIQELETKTAGEREALESQLSEALKTRIQELQNVAFSQVDRLERQIQESQESAEASVRTFREGIDQTKNQLVSQVAEWSATMEARLDQDRTKASMASDEAWIKVERDLEARAKAVSEGLEGLRTEFQNGLDGAQSESALWQAKQAQTLKELESTLDDQYRSFRTAMAERISSLVEEFSQQKEELVTKSNEDRQALRTDLNQIRTSVDELDAALRTRGQAAIELFQREYDAVSSDIQKRNRDLVGDVDNRLHDYRDSMNEIREKAEAMQKKIFGKIEDQASLLSVTIDEIEKRQKSFVAQTKIFERADTLRDELQEAVEDLKSDIARIDVQKKDLVDLEASMTRIKKLGDETSDKAAKFVAEKKRIDLMDADFQRILGLSQAMEVRLEQVTNSHDLLQDIQLRIRKLEDYSKDVEVRYDRLEKRRDVLDTTSDGVDRNFALLEKIEKSVRSLEGELRDMPNEVEELRKRLKVLAAGREDAEKAVERLNRLDQTLRDVESRINKTEQTRDWLANVENRLTETKVAAEEQVHLLATISKATSPGSPKAQSTDSETRQTVLKLARQGWEKDAIARALKLSLGEVELILELGTR